MTQLRGGTASPVNGPMSHLAVLEASPNAILAVDAQARITYVNPQAEATFGYPRGELIGNLVEMLIPDQVADRHVRHRDGFLAHPVPRPIGIGLDLAGRRKDGTEFPVEISLSSVDTDDGVQVFATVVDISARIAARESAESQLLQAQKLESIGRLAGGIAHDFNNMLFAISGYAEMLAQDLSPTAPGPFDRAAALHSVEAISQATERATVLTSHLLAFGRRRLVQPIVLDLNARIHALEPMLQPLIGEKVRLVLQLDPETGHLQADPGQLDQILVNLVVNARDAMPEGGTVTIQTGNRLIDASEAAEHVEVNPGRYVVMSVSDTGTGMDLATRAHIFEPFFTTKDVGKGTGLGLATIYGIVRQAGGHVGLDSEPGKGSTFRLYFPRDDGQPTDELPPAIPIPTTGSGRILVVEDDDDRPPHDGLAPQARRLRRHRRPRRIEGPVVGRRVRRPDRRARDRCRDGRHVGHRGRRSHHGTRPDRRGRAALGVHGGDGRSRSIDGSRGDLRREACDVDATAGGGRACDARSPGSRHRCLNEGSMTSRSS